jgi:ribosome-binding factor A
MNNTISQIKKQQRESVFFKELSLLFRQLALEEKNLSVLYLTRIELSKGNGACTLYFDSYNGQEGYEQALSVLALYKPSIRKVVARLWQSHHTPEILFRYDSSVEKVERINTLFDTVRHDRETSLLKENT